VYPRIQQFFYGNPDQYPPIINSARLIARAGFETDIFCRWDGLKEVVTYPPEVDIHRIKSATADPWREYAGFVFKSMRQASHDAGLFVGHDMHGLVPAHLLGKRHHRDVIYHCHDFAEIERALSWGSRTVRVLERRFARKANVVVVPDADRARIISDQLRLNTPPLIVANAPLQRAIPAVNGRLRDLLQTKGHNFEAILFRQGKIGVGHAIESTLRALPLLRNRNWGFVVMGLSDRGYVEMLLSLAKELGVEKQFAVLAPVGYDEVVNFTGDAQIGHALYDPIHINNQHITTASNKIMEYMEAGLPLLVSETPALKNLVTTYECGVTADEKSPQGIAHSINYLLGQPEQARAMGLAARKAFEEKFCYERQFGPVINIMKEILNREYPRLGLIKTQ
jgi:Glycosyl transferases group 1/Glycosyltransferase Family 4